MSRLFRQDLNSSSHAPEDVDDLLDAADKFSRQFDIEVDDVIRGIAVTLNRRVEFERLRKQFGVSLPR